MLMISVKNWTLRALVAQLRTYRVDGLCKELDCQGFSGIITDLLCCGLRKALDSLDVSGLITDLLLCGLREALDSLDVSGIITDLLCWWSSEGTEVSKL